MTDIPNSFNLDGEPVSFKPGQTILQAALKARPFHPASVPPSRIHAAWLLQAVHRGRQRPHRRLLHDEGGCRPGSAERHAGPQPPAPDAGANAVRRGQSFLSRLREERQLPVAGAGLRPGNVQRRISPISSRRREVDASHPDVFIDRNRCIMCELCVRASQDIDSKNVFGIAGRGGEAQLVVNSPTGKLVDSDFAEERPAPRKSAPSARSCPSAWDSPSRSASASTTTLRSAQLAFTAIAEA